MKYDMAKSFFEVASRLEVKVTVTDLTVTVPGGFVKQDQDRVG